MIITPSQLLQHAQEEHYAVPAFNFYNLDGLFAALEAAEEENAPVIVEIYHAYYPFLHQSVICSAVQEALHRTKIYTYLHLDHAVEQQVLEEAIQDGFQSVMADGSELPLEENIAFTKGIVKKAKAKNVFTEAEVGRVIRIGAPDSGQEALAKVEDCVRLAAETGVGSLAAAVGTAHGMYKAPPKIDFQLIRNISSAVKIPLVLHGGSGIPAEAIQEAIRSGIVKINVGTELKYAWSAAMMNGLLQGEKEPRILSAYAREQVKEIARQKIRLFGASGKSRLL